MLIKKSSSKNPKDESQNSQATKVNSFSQTQSDSKMKQVNTGSSLNSNNVIPENKQINNYNNNYNNNNLNNNNINNLNNINNQNNQNLFDFGTTSIISYNDESLLSRNEISLADSKVFNQNNSEFLKDNGTEQESIDLRHFKKDSEKDDINQLLDDNNIFIESSSLNYQKKSIANQNCAYKKSKDNSPDRSGKTNTNTNSNFQGFQDRNTQSLKEFPVIKPKTNNNKESYRKKINTDSLLSNYEIKNSNEDMLVEDIKKENNLINKSSKDNKDNSSQKPKKTKYSSFEYNMTDEENRCKPYENKNTPNNINSINSLNSINILKKNAEKENLLLDKRLDEEKAIQKIKLEREDKKTNNTKDSKEKYYNVKDNDNNNEDGDDEDEDQQYISNKKIYNNLIEVVKLTKGETNEKSDNDTFIVLLDRIKDKLTKDNNTKINNNTSSINDPSLFPTFGREVFEIGQEKTENTNNTINTKRSGDRSTSNEFRRNLSYNSNNSYSSQHKKSLLFKNSALQIGRNNSVRMRSKISNDLNINENKVNKAILTNKKNQTQKNLGSYLKNDVLKFDKNENNSIGDLGLELEEDYDNFENSTMYVI